jgi:alpha-tubulin suppressor-like RCC1 family protein
MGEGGSRVDKNVLGIPTGVSMVDHLACGPAFVLATTSTGTLLVWGNDSFGQLGRSTTDAKVWIADVSFVFVLAFFNTSFR